MKVRVKIVALGVGAQVRMKMRKLSPIMTSSTNKQTFPKFFNRNFKTFRILKGLNSSLVLPAAELWLTKNCLDKANHTFLVTFVFLPKFGFLSHHFGTRNATKSIKKSKTQIIA